MVLLAVIKNFDYNLYIYFFLAFGYIKSVFHRHFFPCQSDLNQMVKSLGMYGERRCLGLSLERIYEKQITILYCNVNRC